MEAHSSSSSVTRGSARRSTQFLLETSIGHALTDIGVQMFIALAFGTQLVLHPAGILMN
jgi:hypothetical protein